MNERTALMAGSVVIGWCVGWAFAWLTEWLERAADAPGPPRHWALKDPLVQAGSAGLWLAAAAQSGDPLRTAQMGMVGTPLIQVAVTDFRTRYVYEIVVLIGGITGLAFGWQIHTTDWWTGFVGLAVGFAFLGALWLVGRLLYRGMEVIARGDLLIAAMIGAGAGACALTAIVWGVFAGGALALCLLVRGVAVEIVSRRRRGDGDTASQDGWTRTGWQIVRTAGFVYMPYGPGLCLGGIAALFLC